MSPHSLIVAVILLSLAVGCDSSEPETPDPPLPSLVDLAATFELRNNQGEFREIGNVSEAVEALTLDSAWTIEVGPATPYVRADFVLDDSPTRGVPFIFSIERCPGSRAYYDLVIFPAPGTDDPRVGGLQEGGEASKGGCEGRTLTLFYIKEFGGVPGEARVYLDEIDDEPEFTTDLSAHGLSGPPPVIFADDGAGWSGGQSVLRPCYRLSQDSTDLRSIEHLAVYRRHMGYWNARARDGCSTWYSSTPGVTSYSFALDVTSLIGERDPTEN